MANGACAVTSTDDGDPASRPPSNGSYRFVERVKASAGHSLPISLLIAVLVTAAYYGLGRYSMSLQQTNGGISVVWPASGLAIAAVYLGGLWLAPSVVAGSLAIGFTLHSSPTAMIVMAAAAGIEPIVGARLLRRFGFDHRLSRFADVIMFVGLAAVLSTAVGATVGTFGAWIGGSLELRHLATNWRDWWVGDLAGVLMPGALLMVAADAVGRRLSLRRALEAVAVTVAVGALSYWLLDSSDAASYLVLPLLFLLAFAYRQYGAVLGTGLISRIAVYLTAHGHGPFLVANKVESLVRTQSFVCVGAVTALLVAAAMSERWLAARALALLAESEKALHESQRLARLGTFSLEFGTHEWSWSDEVFRILGLDPATTDAGSESWRNYLVPEDVPRLEAAAAKLYLECGADVGTYRVRRPDGQVRHVEVRLDFERDPDAAINAPPIRVRGTLQDVTELTSALERSTALFDHAPYPILVIGDSGTIRQCNRLAQRLFAVDHEMEIVGQPISQFVYAPDPAHDDWHVLSGEDGARPVTELWGRRGDSDEFPAEVSLTWLPTEDGVFVSAAIRDVTELRAAAEKLNFQARHDALTGLPNRLMFLEQLDLALARARRSERPLAVVFADLDNFKLVNDTRGHEVGDLLLTSLTPRLNAAVRQGDLIGRLGGDEFVALCEDLDGEASAMEIAQRLVESRNRTMLVAGQEHQIQLSAGVVLVSDAHGVTARGVLRDADAAMYAAKSAGKGRVALFDDGTRERMVEQIAIESSLRGACRRREFELYYQPVVALDDHTVRQVEALLRWRHPTRGLLRPLDFLPVAESTGLISEIGAWVLEEACRQAVRWRPVDIDGDGLPVSVNISAYELTRSDLASVVSQALRTTGLEPHRLVLEAKEIALLEDEMIARRELGRLKALGVRLVIDDFGTGYSSLPALRNLAVDGLKLDRSFIQALDEGAGEGDGAMFGAVLSIATALEADVTAEGIETWDQVDLLKRHGFKYAQGYLFGQPMPAEQITTLIGGGTPGQPVVDYRSSAAL
jgi:diguanylate cyclase (GGDEF)-like protein/PAS domain S-box-containing protein